MRNDKETHSRIAFRNVIYWIGQQFYHSDSDLFLTHQSKFFLEFLWEKGGVQKNTMSIFCKHCSKIFCPSQEAL